MTWDRGRGLFHPVVAGGVLMVASCGGVRTSQAPDGRRGASVVPSQPVSTAVAATSSPGRTASLDLSGSPTASPSDVGVPTLIEMPAINVRAAVVPLGRNADGTAQVPQDFNVAGWYSGGPRPGDVGPAVMLGHIDSYRGPAVFVRLKDLRAGDLITVWSGAGPRRFLVDSLASFPKSRFPTAAVYGPTPDRTLRLVTCGGAFDDARHSYVDNVVAFATEVDR